MIADVAVFRIKIPTKFEDSAASCKEVNKLEETAEFEDLIAVKNALYEKLTDAVDKDSKILIKEIGPGAERLQLLLKDELQ